MAPFPHLRLPQHLRRQVLSSTPTVPTATYTYNGDGLRTSETASTGTQHFTYDTVASVPEVLNDGNNSYIYGPNGLPIEQVSSAGSSSYFFQNGTGTTRALLSNSGTVGATFDFSPYGTLTKSTGTLKTPLLFAQSYSDPTTGLDYLINRYYNPMSGTFVTVDPDLSTTTRPTPMRWGIRSMWMTLPGCVPGTT